MTELNKQRIKGDPFGISLAWDGFLVSGLQTSIDEVGRVLVENARLRLALEEIIQAADLDAAKWVHPGVWVVISQHLIERARAALDEPHEFRQSVPPAIG